MSAFMDVNFQPLVDSLENRIEEELALDAEAIEEEEIPFDPATTILNGHLLPVALGGKVKNQLIGVPLGEISPKYKKKDTFVVIGRGSQILYRFGDASKYSKSNGGGWRSQAVSILTHGVFNYFMVAVILSNCILYLTTAYENPQPSTLTEAEEPGIDSAIPPKEKPKSDYAHLQNVAACIFLLLYILEFGIKLVARGLYGKRNPFSCLGISWSWLDIFVIAVGLLSMAAPSSRTLHALNGFRALKLIPLFPSWLGGYDRMFRGAWQRLLRIAIFAAVIFFLLSLMGSQLFSNTLRQKCALNSSAVESYKSGEPLKEESFLINPKGAVYYLPCGNSSVSETCPADYVCVVVGENPQDGHVGFDSLPLSAFTLLNVLFQDYAEFVYEEVWAIHGPWHIIYFILAFFLGTFSIGILAYAVVGYEFEKGYAEIVAGLGQGKKVYRGSDDSFNTVFRISDATNWTKMRAHGKKFVSNDYFEVVITFFIMVDVVNFGLDRYGLEDNKPLATFFHGVNQTVYVVYLLEFLLKISFLGVKQYWKKPWNRLDFFVVILIVIQSILEGGLMSYRITTTALKIIPRWPTLNFLLTVVYKMFGIPVRWIYGINGVVLFVSAYAGYVAFGTDYKDHADVFPYSEIPRWNMADSWHSIRLMMRSFSGEWTETMWDLLLVSPAPGAITLMLSSGILGNFLLTCLGVGIMLVASSQLSQSETFNETEQKLTSLERIFSPCNMGLTKVKSWICKESKPPKSEDPSSAPLISKPEDPEEKLRKDLQTQFEHIEKGDVEKAVEDAQKVIEDVERILNGKEPEVEVVSPAADDTADTKGDVEQEGNKVTILFQKIYNHAAYRLFTCILIVLVSICVMYWEFPTEIFFVCYFGLDLIGGVMVTGFSRKLVNIGLFFDACMVLNSILALSLDLHQGIYAVGSFRLFMIVSRIRGLVVVRNQLWKQLCSLWQYFLATFFIWYTFALMGMTFFLGKFSKCVDNGQVLDSPKADCLAASKTWEAAHYNFDSVPNGLWSLVVVATRNGWLDPLHSAEDAAGFDMPPRREASHEAIVYFILFLLMGVMFPLYTMFGVLLNSLRKKGWIYLLKRKDSGKGKTKSEEEQTGNLQTSSPGSFVGKYVNHNYFDLYVSCTILLDSIALALQFSTDENVDHNAYVGLDILRICILVLFTVELVLRGIYLKLSFFKQWLNDLLLLVVLVSLVEFFVLDLGDGVNYFRILRMFRLLHILSLDKIGNCVLPEFKSFRSALSKAYPSLFYILFFYVIIFSSYAVFGSLAFIGVLDFSSWRAMTTLFKIATISGWEGIYDRIAIGGECKDDSGGDCGHPTLGAFYVLTFMALTVLSFVNLYFALILETMNQLGKVEADGMTEDCQESKKTRKEDEQEINVEGAE